jgi:hypothetical protein
MRPKMNAESQTGEMARKIWNALGSRGETTPTDPEMTVDASPPLLDFTHGWRVRENKVEILSDTYRGWGKEVAFR